MPPLQLLDGRRLVAGRLVLADHLEPAARCVGCPPPGGTRSAPPARRGWAALPGISVAKATRSRVRAPTDSFRRRRDPAWQHRAGAPAEDLHVRRRRPASTSTPRAACAPVDEYRETPFGLYMSRAMVEPADRALGGDVAAARPRARASPTGGGTRGTSATRTSTWTSARSSGTATGGGSPTTTWTSCVRNRRGRRGDRRGRVRGRGRARPARPGDRGGGDAPHPPGAGRDRAHGHDLDAWLAGLGITLSWKPRPTR